jgi:hypothetical protein
MQDSVLTVRRQGLFWIVSVGDEVVHQRRSKPEVLAWAADHGGSVYVQTMDGNVARRDFPGTVAPVRGAAD